MEYPAEATHLLHDVEPTAMTICRKGANRQTIFLRKSGGDQPWPTEPNATLPALDHKLYKAEGWSAMYCVVAEPGAVEDGGQGTSGVADVWKSDEEIRKAAHAFMRNKGFVNDMHGAMEAEGCTVVENAVALADFTVGDKTIRKGSWYIAIEPTDAFREKVEKGEITGVSLEGIGSRTAVSKADGDGKGGKTFQIKRLAGEGKSAAQIAESLSIDVAAVKAALNKVAPGSAMVCIRPVIGEESTLADHSHISAEDLHLTLAFVPGVDTDVKRQALARGALEGCMHQRMPSRAVISGPGLFQTPEGPVTVALASAPLLGDLQRSIDNALSYAGLEVSHEHEFQPHFTLAHADTLEEARGVAGAVVWFDGIEVCVDNEVIARIGTRVDGRSILKSAEDDLSDLKNLDAYDINKALDIEHKMAPVLKVSSKVYPSLERVPGKQNWVDRAGGLPDYIERVAKHLHYEKGMTISRAIATAVSRIKVWAATGSAETKAKAVKALAEWNAKRKASTVKKQSLIERVTKAVTESLTKDLPDDVELSDEELQKVADDAATQTTEEVTKSSGSDAPSGTVEPKGKPKKKDDVADENDDKTEERFKRVEKSQADSDAKLDAIAKHLGIEVEMEDEPVAKSAEEAAEDRMTRLENAVLKIAEGQSSQPSESRVVTKSSDPRVGIL